MRVLLCTNNIGNVFDNLEESLDWWLSALDDTLTGSGADFIALHLQELTGTAYKEGNATMQSIKKLSEGVRTRFPDYWSSGIMSSSVSDADFTALGSLFLVRRSVLKDVAIFDFNAGAACGWRPVANLEEPLVPEPALPVRWSRHNSFPRHFFDALAPNWTRKGWLHTRWRIEGQPLDLLNVHLFHDEDNLRALRRAGALSAYAVSRQDALKHALEMVAAAGPAPAALGPLPPALCVFGDFNFRLDLRSVLAKLAGEAALASALSAADSNMRILNLEVMISPPAAAVATAQQPAGWCRCLAALAGAASSQQQSLAVESKRFALDDAAAVFGRDGEPSDFRECDIEITACTQLTPPLNEIEAPSFPPTYAFAVGAPSSPSRPAYGSKRCPSWCDRVLFDPVGMRLMRAARDVAYAAHEQREVARNDHNLVSLAFTLAPTSAPVLHPIPVPVPVNIAAPTSVKVGAK